MQVLRTLVLLGGQGWGWGGKTSVYHLAAPKVSGVHDEPWLLGVHWLATPGGPMPLLVATQMLIRAYDLEPSN